MPSLGPEDAAVSRRAKIPALFVFAFEWRREVGLECWPWTWGSRDLDAENAWLRRTRRDRARQEHSFPHLEGDLHPQPMVSSDLFSVPWFCIFQNSIEMDHIAFESGSFPSV